ncbi:hypothetical protein BN8_p06813 (plasmid) [Fibrisoma limi BUZ 3]|uniref:HTH cro/C1-type domain-containing protein n=2 Tax=Fibrisoma limi TaxID=663275 RepID=I2GU16_9BACT|nr:hypothetical protein BN8_p06813 [Fibrisoma limi BUZ 3]
MHKAIDRKGQEIFSAKPTHPGVVLAEELDERAIKPSAFALQVGVYPSVISDLIHQKRNVTAALALKLEKGLGISAGYWMRLQVLYELNTERLKMTAA